MNKRKEKPVFNVNLIKGVENDIPKFKPQSFVNLLIDAFRGGAYCLLEALRLVKSKDINKDLDLILNDEQHSEEYLMRERFPFIK